MDKRIPGLLLLAALAAACAPTDSTTGPTPVGAPPPASAAPPAPAPTPRPSATPTPSPTSGSLRVTLDAGSCSGRVSSADVTVDGTYAGTVQPGGSVSRTVSIGSHSVSARAREGTSWSFSVSVPAAGYNANMTCAAEPPFVQQLLRDWGVANTQASSGGLPLLRICVRDHECEDGDVIRVSINGGAVLQRELFNAPYCANFRFNPGVNVISVLAVNGTGYKGACDYSNVNTGEIQVSNLRADGSVISSVAQIWKMRSAAGTESNITVNLVR
jgi:hypothetical protein